MAATSVAIRGISGRGFRVKNAAGTLVTIKEGVAALVDFTDESTRQILSRERDNFVVVTNTGTTSAYLTGLSRRGFRMNANGALTLAQVKQGATGIQADLTHGPTLRTLKRQKRDYIRGAAGGADSAIAVYGLQESQAAFRTKATNVGATAILSSNGTVPADTNTVVVNDRTYTFKTTIAAPGDVNRGASSDNALDNLVAAVNGTGTPGTDYFAGTLKPTNVTAAARVGTGATGKVTFTAAVGTAGNSFPSTGGAPNLSFLGATFGAGGGATVVGVDEPQRLYKGQTVTVDITNPYNCAQLRRHYRAWAEVL
jgi:hypothetical protein